MTALWQVSFLVHRKGALAVAAAVEPFLVSLSIFESDDADEWAVSGLMDHFPEHQRIVDAITGTALELRLPVPEVDIHPCPEIDWLSKNREAFPVQHCGRFIVHGAHNVVPRPMAALALQIESGRAFGSGTHGSTQGCLSALEWLARRQEPRHLVDLGCGSGILSIAAARLWPNATILSVDIDRHAVETTRENARINAVARQVRTVRTEGYPRRLPTRRNRPDLVVANILAEPLVRLAPDSMRWLRPGGQIILSGLLNHQERRVLRTYTSRGFVVLRRIRIEGWLTLVIARGLHRSQPGRMPSSGLTRSDQHTVSGGGHRRD